MSSNETPAPGAWRLDAGSSTVSLGHKTFWGLVTVKGEFRTVTGGGELAADGTARGELTLAADSLDTKNAKRDEHLRSADFFDAANHPELRFEAREIRSSGDALTIDGALTVRGTTEPVTLTARRTETAAHAVRVEAETTIDPRRFGVLKKKSGMVKGDTAVRLSLRFVAAS
ncbi:YceI family protein [Streptomyces sp. SPB074]|uniref:YceI family protein n=1 Tax=Streptomyces sp. (strain SPB074) TaxID=465543 RepID=UPI00017F1238|nr:YceI family protein [Streptomyces sp. SPB074]EDY43642.1 YceI like family protein [Streptomyces sp. SPB074]